MTTTVRLSAFAAAAVFASSASAQGLDWRVTPYMWGTSIRGDVGLGPVRREVDHSFSDILNVLSGAMLMHVEAQSGDHIGFGDLAWFAVEPEDEIATVGGVAELELDATILELGYAQRIDASAFEVGLRYWDIGVEIDPALAAGVARGDNWVDLFGGFRHTSELSESWDLTTRANIGAGGSDLTIGVQLEFARTLRRGNAIVAGFRLVDIDYEQRNASGVPVAVDLMLAGATFGFKFD